MLGKLMKYEIKATARVFVPLYGALIILAILNKIFYTFNDFSNINNIYLQRFSEIPSLIATMAYTMIIVAIFVITMIVMIQRFYKNLLGDEGYLMFTLPVQPWMNIVTKLLTSLLWTALSSIVTAISILILAAGSELSDEFRLLAQIFPEIQSELVSIFGVSLGQFVTIFIIACVVSMIEGILQVYASISIGQLFNSHKLLASFGAYIVINMILQTVSTVIAVFASMVMLKSAEGISTMFGGTVWISIGVTVVFGILFYITTNVILTKKLNLE